MNDDPQLMWTFLVHDDIDVHPGDSTYLYREDALTAAEADWRNNYTKYERGTEVEKPPLSWSLVPTDIDLTVAKPWHGVTILVYPVRARGAVLLSPGDTERLLPLLSAACDEAAFSLTGGSTITSDNMDRLRDSWRWGLTLMTRIMSRK